MQSAAFRKLGLRASYELIETPPAQLGAVVARLRDQGYAGWNVTVPHKEHVLSFLNEVVPEAQSAGSVNTVVNRDGVLRGYSTDGYGLAAALRESFGVEVRGRRFLFLGAGGAACAAVVWFASLDAAEICIVNRTLGKAERIAARARAIAPKCRVRCSAGADQDGLRSALAGVDVVIQATSLGLHAGDPLPMDDALLTPGGAVMDMIYRRTPFLDAAARRGCRTADGSGMLLYQGARSFELWTGCVAPVAEMRAGLAAALAAQT
jgi:shikimate dehydrogenase